MLSDALGHHSCLCQTQVPAPGCVLVVSVWFLTGQLFQVRFSFAAHAYCKQTPGSCRSLRSECCLSPLGFQNSSLSLGEIPLVSLGRILVHVLGAKHFRRVIVTGVTPSLSLLCIPKSAFDDSPARVVSC